MHLSDCAFRLFFVFKEKKSKFFPSKQKFVCFFGCHQLQSCLTHLKVLSSALAGANCMHYVTMVQANTLTHKLLSSASTIFLIILIRQPTSYSRACKKDAVMVMTYVKVASIRIEIEHFLINCTAESEEILKNQRNRKSGCYYQCSHFLVVVVVFFYSFDCIPKTCMHAISVSREL